MQYTTSTFLWVHSNSEENNVFKVGITVTMISVTLTWLYGLTQRWVHLGVALLCVMLWEPRLTVISAQEQVTGIEGISQISASVGCVFKLGSLEPWRVPKSHAQRLPSCIVCRALSRQDRCILGDPLWLKWEQCCFYLLMLMSTCLRFNLKMPNL